MKKERYLMDSGSREVARLRQHIENELVGMKQGFSGFAKTGNHAIIAHKYDALHTFQQQLAFSIGDEEATTYVCEASMRIVR